MLVVAAQANKVLMLVQQVQELLAVTVLPRQSQGRQSHALVVEVVAVAQAVLQELEALVAVETVGQTLLTPRAEKLTLAAVAVEGERPTQPLLVGRVVLGL